MKRIVFTVEGRTVGWTALTGLPLPRSGKLDTLIQAAAMANGVDDRIEGWQIVEDGRVLAKDDGGAK